MVVFLESPSLEMVILVVTSNLGRGQPKGIVLTCNDLQLILGDDGSDCGAYSRHILKSRMLKYIRIPLITVDGRNPAIVDAENIPCS